jgi:hypothetical protein
VPFVAVDADREVIRFETFDRKSAIIEDRDVERRDFDGRLESRRLWLLTGTAFTEDQNRRNRRQRKRDPWAHRSHRYLAATAR